MWSSWMHGGAWGSGMGLFWLLLVATLGLAVWAAVGRRPGRGSGGRPAPPLTPLEILQRRYARGEIGREEYERMRRDLT